ncbi:MAG: hypothetical protein R3F50_07125 [Gammaproteobacteria bacterium]|jgi:hypothetical protein
MKKKLYLQFASLLSLLPILLLVQPAQAQEFVWAPDLPVGSSIPPIQARDQNGETKTFDDLVGENGLLLMFSRSFDW